MSGLNIVKYIWFLEMSFLVQLIQKERKLEMLYSLANNGYIYKTPAMLISFRRVVYKGALGLMDTNSPIIGHTIVIVVTLSTEN